ncbi:hypothetical protein HDU76_005028 [Blyttiomyces sp. JEL0837]|nr:hypothetical protein HDU76_005028 [Blyttiomyces sp. JEL0837]
MPLTLYYHADEHLTHCVKSLKKVRDIASDTFRRRNEKVHRAQRLLLDTIYLIYLDTDEEYRSSREYRRQLPPEDQRELEGGFSENILFAAQALSKGFRIRGIEQFTSELVEPAKALCAALDALRFVFRTKSLIAPTPFHFDLFDVIKDFDVAWTAFEQKICFCYFSVTYHGRPGRVDETDMFQVLMSETILRAVKRNYITTEQMQSFDPTVILAIPRLSILAGLIHSPDIVNLTDPENAFRWFRSKTAALRRIQAELRTLRKREIVKLERMLADTEFASSQEASSPSLPTKRRSRSQTTATSTGVLENGGGVSSLFESPATTKESYYESGNKGKERSFGDSGIEPDGRAVQIHRSRSTSQCSNASSCIGSMVGDAAFGMTDASQAKLQELFRSICLVSDMLIRGREFVNVMHSVFSMHSNNEHKQ